MAHLDWSVASAALAAVPGGGVTGDAAAAKHAALSSLGTRYDSRWTDTGVQAAKTAWLVTAELAWTQADEACRYAESLHGTPGSALALNAYDASGMLARIDAAKILAKADAATIAAHRTTIATIYAPYTGPAGHILDDGTPVYPDAYLGPEVAFVPGVHHTLHAWAGGIGATMHPVDAPDREPQFVIMPFSDSVRTLEVKLYPLLVDAAEFLTLAAYT